MPKTIRVTVTQRDIERGVVCNARRCPVALAIARKTRRKNVVVAVGYRGIEVGRLVYHMPAHVRVFANNFDDGRPVKPFSFALEKP